MVCFNCGEVGHFSSVCSKPKVCFICQKVIMWLISVPNGRNQLKLLSTLGVQIGFYNIDVEPRSNRFKH